MRDILDLHNGLRAFVSEKPSRKEEAVGLEMVLEGIVAYRNRILGHGAPLDRKP